MSESGRRDGRPGQVWSRTPPTAREILSFRKIKLPRARVPGKCSRGRTATEGVDVVTGKKSLVVRRILTGGTPNYFVRA
jgi:hypothetical protein